MLPATLVDTQAASERLPVGQAIDTYLPWNYVPTQGDTNGNRWLAGVTFVPRGCPTITVTEEDPCVTMTWGSTTTDSFDSAVTFRSFRMEKAIECSTIGGFSPEELEAWVLAEARAASSYALARHAWGQGVGTNADFRDQADDVTTSDTTALGALSAVVAGLGRRLKGQRGMIHMSPDMAVRLDAAGAIMNVGNGGVETINGHRVVLDDGYDGSGPAGLIAGASFIYGTGPVYFKLAPLQRLGEPYEDFDRVHNDMQVRVEQRGIVLFEPCPVVVARANVATSNV